MHRGSSKGAGRTDPEPETLPLSASPSTVEVRVEIARAGAPLLRTETVEVGSTVRELLRRIGQAPEGSAAFVGGRSIPLDTPIEVPLRLLVVRTFSGG